MRKMKKILALVLAMAMTVTLLPVFAAAEDVAVETVLPVAEAPAAAAPVAVEDVSFIPELPQAQAPAAAPVEAIETVAAEAVPVKAELQALDKGTAFDNDDAALEEGYFLRLDVPGVGSAYYSSFQSASDDYSKNNKSGSVLYLLSDYTLYSTTETTTGVINCTANDSTTTLSNLTFDLNGKTLTAQLKRPLFSRGSNTTSKISMRNGTIVYQNLGTAGRRAIAYTNNTYPTSNAGTQMMGTTFNLTDLTCICMAPLNGGAVPAVISSNLWVNTANITNCTLLSVAGSPVEFVPVNKWSSSAAATQIAYAAQARRNTGVKLEGSCVIGSLTDAPAISYSYPSTVTDNSLFIGLTVDPGPAKKSVFLGSGIAGITNDPADAERLLVTLPDGYTETGSVAVALPDETSFFAESTYLEDVQPGWNEPVEFATIQAPACQHPDKTHFDEVPATYTTAGTAEYYYCPTCLTYWEADGVTETTAAALVLPVLACQHGNLTLREAAPGTFSVPGTAACWYCPDCLKYFTDPGAETETTLGALATGKRDPADTAGLSETQLAELGALMMATAPGGAVFAYDTIEGALALAATWTEPGGEVKLLQDYTSVSRDTSLLWNTGSNAASYHTDSDPLVGTLYGYWIDLGGHTLTVWRPGSVIGNTSLTSVNVKNGKLIHLNADASGSSSSGIFKSAIQVGASTSRPYDTTTKEMYTGRITLYNAEVYSVSGGTAKYPLMCTFWDAEIRLYDSTAIGNYGVFLVKSESAVTDETALANIQAHGFTQKIRLYGSSVLGSNVGNRPTSFRTWAAASGNSASDTIATAEGIAHSVSLYMEPTARLVGSTNGVVSDSSGSTFTLKVVTPEGCDKVNTDVTLQLPSKASLMEITATTVGAAPESDAPATKAGYYYAAHVHSENATHHEAVAPTELTAGSSEYWSCTCGKFFSDEACTVEIEENAWIIPQLTCDHAAKTLRGEVPATFTADGTAEHWYCETCGTYWAADGETETTADALVLPKLVEVAGMTDDQMVELGAVAKAVAPDGTVKAFNTPSAAYREGATWTEPGGVVYMLCDYTHFDTTRGAGTGILNSGATSLTTNFSNTYTNADDPSLKGFWFDFNGHTVVVRSGGAAFYDPSSLPVNVRNGRLIYQNTAGTAASYPALKSGYTSARYWTSSDVYCPEWTLKDMTVIRVPHYGTAATGPVFFLSVLQSKINVINSTVICDDSSNAVFYQPAVADSANAAADAYAATQPYAHEINLSGNSVFGTTYSAKEVVTSKYASSAVRCVTRTISVNVEGDDVVFLGKGIVNIDNTLVTGVSPEGYFSPEATFSFYPIDTAAFAGETTPGAGAEEQSAAVEAGQWIRAHDGSRATFTGEGAESAEMTLTDAFKAWIANGYKGTIRLCSDLSAEDAAATRLEIGEAGTAYTTDTEAYPYEPVYLIPAAASNGDLTFDLNGHTMTLNCGFIGMDGALTNFDLAIENGTITHAVAKPIVVLKGAGGSFKLRGATLACTAQNAYTNPILDARYGGAYAILEDSTVSSAYRAAIALYTTSETGTDGTLLYYVKNCELATTGGDKQPTINSLSSIGSTHRRHTVILDGGTVIRNDKYPEGAHLRGGALHCLADAVNGTDLENLHTITVDGNSKLTGEDPAATVTFGDALTLAFKTAEDAAQFAELFGRNGSNAVTLTLEKDAAVTESKPIGEEDCSSAFTIALNGRTLSGKALTALAGGVGTAITITMADAGTAKLFAGAPEKTFAANDKLIVEKGRFFTNYSLNLEKSVSINLYTDGANGDPDSVSYVQAGKEYTIAASGEEHDWVVDTLAAKQMAEPIDAYAVKTDGATTYLDFVKDVSVKGYAEADPAAYVTDTDLADALNATLKTMLIYGKFAEKYFAEDYNDLTEKEMTDIGVEFIPETDTTNLVHADRAVTGMADRTTDNTATSGFYGTAAVLEDEINLKLYFFGAEFAGKTATVNGEAAALETQDDKYFVKAPVSAKDVDKAITVEIAGVGSVTDSVEAYTARVDESSNTYKLVQALRAYGADAKRFAEAKG